MYEEEKKPSAPLLAAFGFVFCVSLALIYFFVAQKPEPIPAPTGFVAYTAKDQTFKCQAPKDWDREDSGTGGALMASAIFRKGNAKVDITSDLIGSLMGDIIESGDRQMSGMLPGGMAPQARPAVEKLHLQEKAGMKSRIKGYEETEMRAFTSPLGEARVSEFTGEKPGFPAPVKVRGYRTTILGNERRVTVLCECPEPDWSRLKPAFNRVIGSLGPGGA